MRLLWGAIAVWTTAIAVAAQTPAAPVFTAAQATAGKAGYAKHCGSCHMPDLSGANEIPALAGDTFLATWGGRSTKELFTYISASMPYGQPSLTVPVYGEITAYILQANGAPAGSVELTPATTATLGCLRGESACN